MLSVATVCLVLFAHPFQRGIPMDNTSNAFQVSRSGPQLDFLCPPPHTHTCMYVYIYIIFNGVCGGL
ncbi:hypothetical protein HanRHA438_Chr02g0091711 [Helianthus annuus]|nr:hypothetical protein HanRHA438_Chr02g0091711 [Helianthus annuus]